MTARQVPSAEPRTTLVSVSELADQLRNPASKPWAIVDCRFDLAAPEAGHAAFLLGHLPGAAYAHLDRDLSSPITAQSGRHPLPDPNLLARKLGAWGIGNDTQVIAYDADNGAYAARLWWLIRWLGGRKVAVLDGGLRAWLAAGLPLATDPPSPHATVFVPQVDAGLVMNTPQIVAGLARSDWRLLDARSPERYAGKVEPLDQVAGHVPGARNLPFLGNLASDGRFLPPDALRRRLQAALDGVRPDRAVVMCGSGVTACHHLLACEIAGLPGARLYPGSWSEWIRDPQRPVATAAEQTEQQAP